MKKSYLEESMALQISEAELPEPEREKRFHPIRRWRFDFYWPDLQLALECEGMVFAGGRHTRGTGFTGDCEKYNEAVCMGIAVLRVTATHIKDGSALRWLKVALNGRRGNISVSESGDQLGSTQG